MAEQLSFTELFEACAFEASTRHLPAAMSEAVPCFHLLIERYNAAILAADLVAAEQLNKEAHDLAIKLNNGNPAILAEDDSPGNVLEYETTAPDGLVPLWGQTGTFIIEPQPGLLARIQTEGIFGLAATPLPGFMVHAVDFDRPFLSETGFRSFLGWRFQLVAGMTPDSYASAVINDHIGRHLKGRLYRIEAKYKDMHRSHDLG